MSEFFFTPLTSSKAVRTLQLSGQQLQTVPEDVSGMSELEELNMSDNPLGPQIHRVTEDLPAQLCTLQLDRARISQIPEKLPRKLGRLTRLSVAHNSLAELPYSLSLCGCLQMLDASHNLITALPRGLAVLSALTALQLAHNRFGPRAALILDALYTSPGSLSLARLCESAPTSASPSLLPPSTAAAAAAAPNLMESATVYDSSESDDSDDNRNGNQIGNEDANLLSNPTPTPTPTPTANAHANGPVDNESWDILLPSLVCRLPALHTLDLGRMSLTSVPIELTHLIYLTRLSLNSNRIQALPSDLTSMTTLRTLDLRENPILSLLAIVGRLPHLRALQFDLDNLSQEHEKFLLQRIQWPRQSLNLNPTAISTPSQPRLYQQPHSSSSSSGLSSMWKTALSYRGLNPNSPSSSSSPSIPLNPQSVTVTSDSNSASSKYVLKSVPIHIVQFQWLRTCDLSGNRLSSLPDKLTLCSRIRRLILSNNCFSSIPTIVVRFKRLQQLVLDSNQIESLPTFTSDLTSLTTFDLRGNPLPSDVLTVFNIYDFGIGRLDLSKKNLTYIPEVIHHLPKLHTLDLSHNLLSSIPDTIGTVTTLINLDLSYNRLSTLPSSMGNLTRLAVLRLDNNRFSIYQRDSSLTYSDEITSPYSGDSAPSHNRRTSLAPYIIDPAQNGQRIGMHRRKSTYEFEDDTADSVQLCLPPELCELKNCEISLLGNMKIPSKMLQKFPEFIQSSKLSSLVKSLKILRILRMIPSHDTVLAYNYEQYACKKLSLTLKESGSHERTSLISADIIKLAVEAEALDLLGDSRVQESINETWTNRASLRRYLMEKEGKVSWFENGIWKGIAFWAAAVHHETPKFMASPGAKFYFSALVYGIYLTIITFYLVQQNSTYETPTYFFTSTIRNSVDPSNYIQDSVPGDPSFWGYLSTTFIPFIVKGPDKIYNPKDPKQKDILASYFRVIGPVRLRQLRSKLRDCSSLPPVRSSGKGNSNTIESCVRPFTVYEADDSPYGPGKIFKWKSIHELGSYDMFGQLSNWYDGSGYAYHLSHNLTEMMDSIQYLQDNNWIDLQTRAVFIEFMAANDNADILTFGRILFEIPATGSLLYKAKYFTVTKSSLDIQWDGSVALFAFLFLYAVGLVFHEYRQLVRMRKQYFRDVWNMMDIFMICLLWSAFALTIVIMNTNVNPFSDYDFNIFRDFQKITYTLEKQKQIMTFLLLCSWLRLLYFLGVHSSFGPMQIAVGAMTLDMAKFLLLLAIFLVAFSSSFYAVFGGVLADYSTIRLIGYSLGQALFTSFDFDSLNEADPFLGPILLFAFMLICGILLLNYLIAILSGTYDTIRRNSVREYKKIFAKTVVTSQESPWPPPLNLIWPIIGILIPIWRKMRPLIKMVKYYLIYSGTSRMFVWPFLWDDLLLENQVDANRFYPNIFMVQDFDIVNGVYLTIWIDYLVVALSWVFAIVSKIIFYIPEVIFRKWNARNRGRMGFDRKYHQGVFGQMAQDFNKYASYEMSDLADGSLHGDIGLKSGSSSYRKGASIRSGGKKDKIFSLSKSSSNLWGEANPVPFDIYIWVHRVSIRCLWILTMPVWCLIYFLRHVIWEFKNRRRCANFLAVNAKADVVYSQDRLIVTNKSQSQFTNASCILAEHAWEPSLGVSYFEVEVLFPGSVAIGLVRKDGSNIHILGDTPGSIGLKADDGHLVSPHFGSHQICLPWSSVGSIVGCGVDFGRKAVFFTYNGCLLPNGVTWAYEDPVYPAVQLSEYAASVRVNFGSSPFHAMHPSFSIDRANKFEKSKWDYLQVTPDGSVVSYQKEEVEKETLSELSLLLAHKGFKYEPEQVSYYEVEILHSSKYGEITMGLAHSDIPRSGELGITADSIGISYLPEADFFVVRSSLAGQEEYTYRLEDFNPDHSIVMGCGIDFKTDVIFFVVNGILVHAATYGSMYNRPIFFPGVILDAFGQLLRASWKLDVGPSLIKAVRSIQTALGGKTTQDRDGRPGKKSYLTVDKTEYRGSMGSRGRQSGTGDGNDSGDITDDNDDDDDNDTGVGDRRHRINQSPDHKPSPYTSLRNMGSEKHSSIFNLRDRTDGAVDGGSTETDHNVALRLLTRQGRSVDASVPSPSSPSAVAAQTAGQTLTGGDSAPGGANPPAPVVGAGVGGTVGSVGRNAGEVYVNSNPLMSSGLDAGASGPPSTRGKAARLLYAASILSVKGKQASAPGHISIPVIQQQQPQPPSSSAALLTPNTAAAAAANFASQFVVESDSRSSHTSHDTASLATSQHPPSSPNGIEQPLLPQTQSQPQPPTEHSRPVHLVDRVHRIVGEHRRRQSAIQGTFRSDRPTMASVVAAAISATAGTPPKSSLLETRFPEADEEHSAAAGQGKTDERDAE